MGKRDRGLPVDNRLIPNIISFKYPKNRWVRFMLATEMIFAVLAVVGTLILTLLPRTSTQPPTTNAETSR